MSAFRARDGPARVGDESGERECAMFTARWGIRERGRTELRGVGSSFVPFEVSFGVNFEGGLTENGSSGEKGGDDGSAGEDS
jgi:hypothetical protein